MVIKHENAVCEKLCDGRWVVQGGVYYVEHSKLKHCVRTEC